jgi:glycosyltransferase involved in cell wall biosynthesis
MRIAHVVVTDAFAGTERYVADVATVSAMRGHEVIVFGGAQSVMPNKIGREVGWRPSPTPRRALRQLAGAGRFDVVHAHLTHAETAAVLTRACHRGAVIATRHIAQRRGSSTLGCLLAPLVGRGLNGEIAISAFVASTVGLPPESVLHNGVANRAEMWSPDNLTVVMAQRLEPEKDSKTGLRAWKVSGLGERGWQLLVAGDGQQRRELEMFVDRENLVGVTFLGQVSDMDSLWTRAGILLATAAAEPLGLTVLEAMAAGVPVVACATGGHLETIGTVTDQPGFPAGDINCAARRLTMLAGDVEARRRLGAAERLAQRRQFNLQKHVERLLVRYEAVRSGPLR